MSQVVKYLKLGKAIFNNIPSYIVFHVTSICDAKCKMCFVWENLNTRVKEQLTLEEIDKMSKSLNSLQYVTLGGGEPFLRKDLAEICKIFYKNNQAQIFSIPTNCLHPERVEQVALEIVKSCPDAILKMTLSLDGVNEDHDFIRGVRGNFPKFLETYKRLDGVRKKYRNLEINVNTTFSAYNQDKVLDVYNYVRDNLDADLHGVTFVRGRAREDESKIVSVEKYAKVIKHIEEDYIKRNFRKKSGFKNVFPALSILTRRQVLREVQNNGKRVFDCYAGKSVLHIDAFGTVFACEYLPDKPLGKLREHNYDIKEILKLENTKDTLQFIKDKKCACTWECAIKSSMIYDIKNYPGIAKEVMAIAAGGK